MPRYRLTLEYDGGPFHGFQAQAGLPSVQEAVEAAVEAFCGQKLRLQREWYTPVGMRGWSVVVFRRDRTGARVGLPVDSLIPHLQHW